MKDKERDIFDDLCRSKLQDFEADTMPGDWEAIADRLEVKKSVSFRQTLRYWVAAAVVSLLVVTGGVYVFNRDREHLPVAETIQKETEAVETQLAEQAQLPVAPAVAVSTPVRQVVKHTVAQVVATTAFRSDITEGGVVLSSKEEDDDNNTITAVPSEATEATKSTEVTEIAETTEVAVPVGTAEKKRQVKKWSFGMGGGSVSAGTSNSLNAYVLKNTMMADQALSQLNSPHFNSQSPKTNVRHKTPVSIGLGVGYSLNDRFSLQSGLNYTFLSSEWETGAVYRGEAKQKLHFLGIPLSLSYKIAEWKRIQFYAAAGGMTEVNVSGKQNAKIFVENNEIRHEKKHIRMKEWMWSVNARAGASYPLFRFLSVYAEVGAGYYFDNGSDIETIRSEKPFNVNLQAGFRFGF